MHDLILQTEPAEFQYSKQTTKMAFLHQEIRQLQEYIHDLEKVVKLNKDAMRVVLTPPDTKSTQSKSKHAHNDTLSTTASANEGSMVADKANVISMQQIIDHLNQENVSLLNTAQRLRKEREVAESRALISEQISEEAQRHENEVLMEMEEKIYELRKLVQDKEYTIQELEKIKPIPDGADVAIKYREVISPSEQSLKLLEEIDTLNKMIAKLSKELNKLQVEKEELLHKNMNLTTEIRKLEVAMSSPFAGRLSVKKMTSNQNNVSLDDNNNKYPVFENNDPDQSDILVQLPEKVVSKSTKGKNPLVPKLNLAPAQQLQENDIGAKKPSTVQGNPLLQEKILKLEKEIDCLKKLLNTDKINNNLLSDEIAKLHRQNVTLISQNDTLIKSNKRYEEKAQKMHYTLEFYKEFYEKYMDMVTKRHNPTKSLSSQADFAKLMNVKKPSETLNAVLNAPPIIKHSKPLTSVVEEQDHQVNISILEEDEATTTKKQENLKVVQKMTAPETGMLFDLEEQKDGQKREITKEDCKIFLLNLAKDLYMNSNITKSVFTKQILMNMDSRGANAPATQVVKLKRSLSNPLDYITPNKQMNKAALGNRKPIQNNAKKQRKMLEENSPVGKEMDLNISVIGKQPGNLFRNHASKKSIDGGEMSFLAFDDGKFTKNQDMSFISNDGLF